MFKNIKKVLKFFEQLSSLSKENNMDCRDIEKAYFKKDLEESLYE